MNIKEAKGHARNFLRNHYSDKHLVKALDHARAEKLAFCSCCCFVGLVTARHALVGQTTGWRQQHYNKAKELVGAESAEMAAHRLSNPNENKYRVDDGLLRRRLIPMFLAEIKRRNHARMEAAPKAVHQPKTRQVLQKA